MPLHTSQGVRSSSPLTCRPLMTSVTAGGYTQSLLHRLWWLSSILCPHLVILLPNCHWMCLVLLSWWLVTDWTLYPLLIHRYLLLCAPLLMYATICLPMIWCNYDMLLCNHWSDQATYYLKSIIKQQARYRVQNVLCEFIQQNLLCSHIKGTVINAWLKLWIFYDQSVVQTVNICKNNDNT